MTETPSPTHASLWPWNNKSEDWQSVFRYLMVEEMRLPEHIVARAEAAYLKHGGTMNPRAFTRHATTEAGWEGFLGVLGIGVPLDYLFHFGAVYDLARSSDDWEYGSEDVLEAWYARIPVDFVRSNEAFVVKETAASILLLVAKGVNVEYASAGTLLGHRLNRVLEAWNEGIPLEYIPTPASLSL